MTNLIEIWYAAAHSPCGYTVETSDFDTARQRLYAERRAIADPILAGLSICQSPTSPNDLWIVKKARADADPA